MKNRHSVIKGLVAVLMLLPIGGYYLAKRTLSSITQNQDFSCIAITDKQEYHSQNPIDYAKQHNILTIKREQPVYITLASGDEEGISESRLYINESLKIKETFDGGTYAYVAPQIELNTSNLNMGENKLEYITIDKQGNKNVSSATLFIRD